MPPRRRTLEAFRAITPLLFSREQPVEPRFQPHPAEHGRECGLFALRLQTRDEFLPGGGKRRRHALVLQTSQQQGEIAPATKLAGQAHQQRAGEPRALRPAHGGKRGLIAQDNHRLAPVVHRSKRWFHHG